MLLRQEALVIVERGFPEARGLGEGRTVCYYPMRCSPPGSSVQGILRARILQWAAMRSSRGSSQSRDRTQVSHTASGFPAHQGSPRIWELVA